MDSKTISEIQSALSQMEAEDRAIDQQRRGRAKLKILLSAFQQIQEALPGLERTHSEWQQKIANASGHYKTLDDKLQAAFNERSASFVARTSTAKVKMEEWEKKVADLGVVIAGLQGEYASRKANLDKEIVDRTKALDRVKSDRAAFQRKMKDAELADA